MENWKSVVGYEGLYEVSDLGRVRSLDRRVPSRGGWRVHRGKLLKSQKHPNGVQRANYLHVGLSADGLHCTRLIHHLVLEAFREPRPAGKEARHLNGRPSDCRLRNLVWGAPPENAEDRRRHGTSGKGEQNAVAKLATADVLLMRSLAGKEPQRVTAARFGVTQQQVSRVVTRRRWSHV